MGEWKIFIHPKAYTFIQKLAMLSQVFWEAINDFIHSKIRNLLLNIPSKKIVFAFEQYIRVIC
jgi:hypothetical protein